MPMDVTAKITRTATLTSVTSSRTGSLSRPKSVVSVPNGTTENAAKAVAVDITGAIANRNASAAFGRRCSLNTSLMTSANGCSNPSGPTRFGPSRSWMYAQTLRSIQTMNADASTRQLNTTKINTRCAISGGLMKSIMTVQSRCQCRMLNAQCQMPNAEWQKPLTWSRRSSSV